jgi:hypothetical protein
MAYIDNPYANSLRQAQAMPAVQQALGGYEGGMDGLMRLFQQQYSRPQQQTNIYNPQVETQQTKQRMPPISTPDQLRNQTRFRDNEPSAPAHSVEKQAMSLFHRCSRTIGKIICVII